MSDFQIQSGQTVVFAGDSITDCGRRGDAAPYGVGYVRQCIELITARYPERDLSYFNAGIGGNTVLDLQGRWDTEMLAHNPDWLTVLIGINDLHRSFNATPEAVPVDRFEAVYREILQRAKDHCNPKLVLLDPFYLIQPEDANEQQQKVLAMLPDYIAVARKMAQEFGALHVPMHDLYQQHLQRRPAETFCPEPVHPNPAGHHVMALALLEALGW